MRGLKALTRPCVLVVHMKQSSRDRDLIYCSSLHIILPYHICARSEGSDEKMRTRLFIYYHIIYVRGLKALTRPCVLDFSYTTISCVCED